MGVCCQTRVSIKNEDLAREIISEIKLSQLTYKEFRSKLYKLMGKKLIIDKSSIEENLAEIFYEENKLKNQNATMHKKFFEEIFYWLNQKVKIYEILFFAYPLLSKIKGEEHNEFSDILVNYFDEDYFSVTDLHVIFLKLFELYTFKITKLIQTENEGSDGKNSMNTINKYFFTFEKIDFKVACFLKKYECENKEEKNIYFDDFKYYFREQGLFSVNQIRDYVMQTTIE